MSKPRLWKCLGMWMCGHRDKPLETTVAMTPLDAYWLWLRCQS